MDNWLIFSLVIGMALKSMFHKWDDSKVAAFVNRGQQVPVGTRKWQRTAN